MHKCMSFVIQAATAVCAAPFVARCCDTLHREVRPFISFYILDGAEQYAHTLCGTTQCPRGDVSRDDLDNTERVCRTRKVRVLKAALLKARAEMWDDAAGKPKHGQGKKVVTLHVEPCDYLYVGKISSRRRYISARYHPDTNLYLPDVVPT